ncbi:calcium-binding protein [Streptomyces sp. NPDC018964]|uniref:calcium-binding protein n=1 Tax=unclassified Streptomyces TaxID=2593676 RepID=UPI0037A14ABD
MRRQVTPTVVAICGSLALGGLMAPDASAAGDGPEITKVVVNGGKNIVVGPTAVTYFTASVTASDPAGVKETWLGLWHGSGSYEDQEGAIARAGELKCTASSSTTTTCTSSFQVDANARAFTNEVTNAFAGVWHVSVGAFSGNRVQSGDHRYSTVKVQRASRLTVNATPEPVRKGKTVTVTGKLSRANWDTHKYAGYSGRPVKLQFRKKGSTTYSTIKTVTTSSTGTLKTTVKASVDGYYRYSFAGTSTTPAVNASGDFIDVR